MSCSHAVHVAVFVSPLVSRRSSREHVFLVFSASLLLLASESSYLSFLRARRLAGVFSVCLAFCCCLLKILLSFLAFVRLFVPMCLTCVCVCVETHVHTGFWIFVSPPVSPLVSRRSFKEHVVLVFSAFLLLLVSESSCPSLLRARRLAGVFSVFLAFCCCLLRILLSFRAFVRVFVPMWLTCVWKPMSTRVFFRTNYRMQGMLWKWHEAKPRPHFWIGTGLSLQPLLDMA